MQTSPSGSPRPDVRAVLWAAFIPVPLMMGFLAHVLVPPPDGFPMPSPRFSEPLHVALALLALAAFAGSFFVQKGDGLGRSERVDPRWIIRLALGESVSIFGFLLTQLTAIPGTWVPFTVGSIVALLSARPR